MTIITSSSKAMTFSNADIVPTTSSDPEIPIKKEEKMPTDKPKISRRASLVAKAHEVSGEALIVKTGNENILRFENLKTTNGPDLRIYLATDLSAKDYVDLGPIRATEGNVNYTIPTGTDLTKYRYALIWCRAFSVLFSYGEL